MNEAAAEKDYVEPALHDMRRSKVVNADLIQKLETQAEESKEEQKRPSRSDMIRGRQH